MNKIKLKELGIKTIQGIKDSKYGDDVMPAWIADMNLEIAVCIKTGLINMVENSICGYPQTPYDLRLHKIFKHYVKDHFDWSISSENVIFLKDVVQGICRSIYSFTNKGDSVLIQPPVYQPFHSLVNDTGRNLLYNPLMRTENGYQIDFDDFEIKAKSAKLFIFCNPQNPTGRVFSFKELRRLADICVANKLIVVSDEIHADLVLSRCPHIPLASIGKDIARQTVTLMSASKAYNIAGISLAFGHVESVKLKNLFASQAEAIYGNQSILALEAVRIALTEGGGWLKNTLSILRKNRLILQKHVEQNWNHVKYLPGEGTYLAWLDCRTVPTTKSLTELLLSQSKIAVTEGGAFGSEGEGFIRLNFARNTNEFLTMLERMDKVLRHG